MNKPSKKYLRNTGSCLAILMLILFVLIPYILFGKINLLTLFLLKFLLLVSIVCPFRILKPYIYWIKIGNFLSLFNKKIILITFFYLLITPFGIIIRLMKFTKISILKKQNSNYKIVKVDDNNFIDQY